MDDRHDDLGTWLSGWVDPLYPPPGTFDPDQAARGASSTASQLDPDFCLVAVANGQIVLTAAGEEFYERVDWSGDEPVAGGLTRIRCHRSGSIRWCVPGRRD